MIWHQNLPDMQGSIWIWKVSPLKELFNIKWHVSAGWHLFVSPMYICRNQTRQPTHKQHEDGFTRGCFLYHWPFGTPPVTDGFCPSFCSNHVLHIKQTSQVSRDVSNHRQHDCWVKSFMILIRITTNRINGHLQVNSINDRWIPL